MRKNNSKQTSNVSEPREEDIALLAHSIFETEGRRDGYDIEHWLRAKDQLSVGRPSAKKAKKMLVIKAR